MDLGAFSADRPLRFSPGLQSIHLAPSKPRALPASHWRVHSANRLLIGTQNHISSHLGWSNVENPPLDPSKYPSLALG